MNNCSNCNYELVNIIYGKPSSKLINMARNEDIAIAGRPFLNNLPTHYCYGCHETYSVTSKRGNSES